MSGTHITDRQVHLYMAKRKDHTQEVAAAKAGMSVRTARRVTKATELPSQKSERDWRTRTKSFADVWDSEIVPLLRCSPKLKAIILLRKLQEDHAAYLLKAALRTSRRNFDAMMKLLTKKKQ
jgi:hypothetical protein